jgi:HEAT repeat protein
MLRVVAGARPDVLFNALENAQNRKFRRAILEALNACGPAVAHLVKQRMAAPEWYVVRNMLVLAPRVGLIVADVAPMLKHPHAKVRVEAARALRGMALDPRASELLASLLDDPEAEVQAAAVAGLAEAPLTPGAIVRMEQVVLDEKHSDDLRLRAIEALGRSPTNEAAHALYRLLEPRGVIERPFTSTVRERAALALSRSQAPGAGGLFASAQQSATWRVRKACEKALEENPDG